MSEKFIKRLKKRIVISTLTMFVILSQTVPTIVNAASNDDIMDVINGGGTETSIVIEEDAIEAPAANPVVKERSEDTSDTGTNNTSSDGTGSYSTSNGTSSPAGLSLDGREYKHPRSGKIYKTEKYWAEQHPELKEDLDNYFGEKNLINAGYVGADTNGFRVNERTCLWDAITYKDQVYKALKNKTQRDQLAEIAVKNGIIENKSCKAAPYVALFEYYGIINRDDGLLDYSSGSKSYLSREQAQLMLVRFMHPDSYFGSDGTYRNYYDKDMLIGAGKNAVTEKELASNMTRLEFIYMLVGSYFPTDMHEAMADGSHKDAAKIFKDIDKGDYINDSWLKSRGIIKSTTNDIEREMVKAGKLSEDEDAHIQAAYKLGILTKDSKGNANLFEPITFDEAIIMLINAGIGQADGKSIN